MRKKIDKATSKFTSKQNLYYTRKREKIEKETKRREKERESSFCLVFDQVIRTDSSFRVDSGNKGYRSNFVYHLFSVLVFHSQTLAHKT